MDQNCPDKNPIDEFKAWALKLGCPVSALPSDAALNRLVKSNHANLQKLMDQVRPKSEVKLIRDNILIKMNITRNNLAKGNIVSEQQLSMLPKRYQNLKKVEKLNSQINDLKPRVEQLKIAVKEKQLAVSKKAEQVVIAKQKFQSNQSKSIKLQQKRAQLIEKIEQEKEVETMLRNCTPVDPATSTKSKDDANKALDKAVSFLNRIYDEIGDRAFTHTERMKVEQELKKIMSGIPVTMLFEAIKFHNEKEMKAVDETFCSTEVIPENSSIHTAYDVIITKAKFKAVLMLFDIRKLKAEKEIRVQQYVQLYDDYLAKIITEMRIFNPSDNELFADQICSDYLKEYGTWMVNQAMLDYLKQKLAQLQQLATEQDDKLRDSDLIIAELSGMYDQIQKNYNLILDDMESLGDINKNMKNLQSLSKYTINCNGDKSIWNTSVSTLNSTLGSIAPTIAINSSPAEYLTEISMMVDILNVNWNKLPLKISMEVSKQNSKLNITPLMHLLTPDAGLKELTLKWSWIKAINDNTNIIEMDIVVPKCNTTNIVSLASETTKMDKLIEEVKFMFQAGRKTVTEIQKYLAFLLDTSLGSFIPGNVLINGRTFQDYEQEFLCACSIISNSVKKN